MPSDRTDFKSDWHVEQHGGKWFALGTIQGPNAANDEPGIQKHKSKHDAERAVEKMNRVYREANEENARTNERRKQQADELREKRMSRSTVQLKLI